jgi:uracil-DNA glycosylase family protein
VYAADRLRKCTAVTGGPSKAAAAGATRFVPDTNDLAELAEAARSCQGCELYEPATQTVFGRGSRRARLLLVGEQPGDVEDLRGAPFVGPAGALLDRALTESHIDRQSSYLTNAVKHFHFVQRGKRRLHQTPRVGHVNACRPWLAAEVRAVAPELIVCLGATAARAALGSQVRVLRDRGVIIEEDGLVGPGPFMVTVHPSAVLRAEAGDRDRAFADLVADLTVAARYLGD